MRPSYSGSGGPARCGGFTPLVVVVFGLYGLYVMKWGAGVTRVLVEVPA